MTKTTTTIKVNEDNHNKRLDIIVAEKLGISRSQAQKLFDAGQVTVNGKAPRKAGDTMKTGYTIIIDTSVQKVPVSKKALPINQPNASKQKTAKALVPKVIAETKEYIVINKPSGLLVHPTQANEKNSLVAWLLKMYPELKTVGDDPDVRPGIVHRLDKEASGLMVIARTQKMFEHLKNQFKERTVEKEYYALSHGKVAKEWDEITFPIARSGNADRMAARPITERGAADDEKEAKTEFIIEQRFINFTLLRVIIHTGRMHQIRVHLLGYNHPLVGDPLYFQKKRRRTWDDKLGRLFLHSTKLGFKDLNNETQVFNSPLPKELSSFLALLA